MTAPHDPARGLDLPQARLNPRAVRAIRRNVTGMTVAQQALVYGVHRRTIERVRAYETWRWVR